VSIHTSLNVTGRPAQFGRSLLPEVSGKLIDQFAANLEALIEADGAAETGPAATAEGAPQSGSAQTAVALPQQEDSLNLIKLVGGPMLKRVIPVAAVAAVLAIFRHRIRSLFTRSKA